MAVDQLPGRVREFVSYLNGLLSRLDQGAGWCAVFWQRDPDGMRACLEGHEVPPWDVVEAVLQDLAAEYGAAVAAQQEEHVRPLHAAALAAHDARPGGRDALGDRLDVMLREQRYAAERLAGLGRRLSGAVTEEEADAVRLELAWARDDHERATARCAELRYRIAEFDRLPAAGPHRGASPRTAPRATDPATRPAPADGIRSAHGPDEPTPGPPSADPHEAAHDTPAAHGTAEPSYGAVGARGVNGPASGRSGGAYGGDAPADGAPAPGPGSAAPSGSAEDAPAPVAVPKQRKRRRGSARFAGLADDDAVPADAPPADRPAAPAPAARRTPRGARFAGAAAEKAPRRSEPQREPLDDVARRETVEAVQRLVRLRGDGRSGEAHALLVELASWPAARIPLLAAELQRAGLTADWTTLLWEAASLPADRLVAAADALVAVGRTADGEQILRQGVARPAAEIGRAVLALSEDGRPREVRALLDAYVRVRTPEEAARSAAPAPRTLVPLLLEAARSVSEERHWDLVHALRVAGFTA
ncbi:hypothetical protein JHN59_06385 [Streptomyces sp. MBT49]|uniref:hypothetical protein n=1 Tax=Streptomyces sp. MBT49 TaxID=1488380 RepID=UPI00190BCBFD|nr:hypothetical protein [Streptomyces sp. MBT49]MBK3624474.1 hypothetical protein [Streptomyces sp. MBT49]